MKKKKNQNMPKNWISSQNNAKYAKSNRGHFTGISLKQKTYWNMQVEEEPEKTCICIKILALAYHFSLIIWC